MKGNKIHKLFQRLLLLMVFGALSVMAANAQKTISGVVKDSDGEPLVGANVIIKGTTTGTATDFDGNYSIEVESDDVILVFSGMGMAEEEKRAGDITDEPMILLPDLIGLDEVVVVGYGTLKKRDVTGSVSSMDSEALLSAPITSIDAGMQGKMAGVSIQQTSGAPGQAMKMRVRGGGSINYDNQPLYVIDGFVGGDISSVSPQDIERIDILKDASATAVYGSRGANGVVLITTKTAKKGEMKITLDGTYGISKQVSEIDMLDAGASAEVWNESRATNPYFTEDEVSYFKSNGGEDYMDLLTRTAINQNYNISMSGGSDKLTYLFSGGYLDNQGVINNSYNKRYSVRSNIKADIKPWLEMKFNTYGTHSQKMFSEANSRFIMDSYMYPMFWKAHNPDGTYSSTLDQSTYNGAFELTNPNPVHFNDDQANGEDLTEGVTSTLDLTFKITDHLKFTTSNSGRYWSNYYGQLASPFGPEINEKNKRITQRNGRGRSLLTTNMLTYSNEFGQHSLTAQALYEYSSSQTRQSSITVKDLTTNLNDWRILNNGTPDVAASNFNERYIQSYMGRANYTFANKYLLTATVRVDQTSVFQKDNRTGIFPSFGAGWVVSDEFFMSSVEWVSNLKLRAGYGETGNQAVGPYATLNGLRTYNPILGESGWFATFDGANALYGVMPANRVTSPDIKWETTVQYNVGADLSIYDGMVNFIFDYYKKRTKDVILQKSLPAYTGKLAVVDNFGTIDNQGFEIAVDWGAINRADFNLNVGANLSANKNKVIDLGGQDFIFMDESSLGGVGMWNYKEDHVFIVQKGESMGQIYGITDLGLWQEGQVDENGRTAADYGVEAGNPRYLDLNDDGKINVDDRQVIGNTQPDFTYGLNLGMTYKDFTLNISGFGSHGGEIYNYTKHYMDLRFLNPDYNSRWTPTNTGSDQMSAMSSANNPSSKYVSSRYVENGSFFKINNVTLGYTVPASLLPNVYLNVFASVNNLLTITKYSGIDPENASTNIQSDAMSGLDAFSYPLSRTYTFGFKLRY